MSLVSTIKETAAPSEKEGDVSVNFMMILRRMTGMLREADGVPVCFNRAVLQGTPLSTLHFENHSLTIPFAVFITAHMTLPN